mmetsp:Transcript_4851/g.12285  ORF Transcript_4851/g.12285 Transcript_4851/m.12285 type:complete len:339 (+) Transcript_4851:1187-2203(+)
MLSATCCAPAIQQGSGLILFPEKRRPRGNGRSNQPRVRRCSHPASGGGFAASRTIALEESFSSVRGERRPRCGRELPMCRPSIWLRSVSGRPRAMSSRSSLMEVIGKGHLGGREPKKSSFGRERRAKQAAYRLSVMICGDFSWLSLRWAFSISATKLSPLKEPFMAALLKDMPRVGVDGTDSSFSEDESERPLLVSVCAPREKPSLEAVFHDRSLTLHANEPKSFFNEPRLRWLPPLPFWVVCFWSFFRCFTLPLTRTRSLKSRGESDAGRLVATKSSYGSRASSRYLMSIRAMCRCCGGLQCISSDSTTGRSEVTNAHSPIAFATSSNCSTVQNVCP